MSEWKDPYDILLLEHDGRMHGTCFRLVHRSELFNMIRDLYGDGLAVREIKKRGWVQDDSLQIKNMMENFPDMFKRFRGARED